jgi:hypothetical protein
MGNENSLIAEMLEREQKQRAVDAIAFAADMEGLASRQQTSWPASLRTAFQQNAKAAVEV